MKKNGPGAPLRSDFLQTSGLLKQKRGRHCEQICYQGEYGDDQRVHNVDYGSTSL